MALNMHKEIQIFHTIKVLLSFKGCLYCGRKILSPVENPKRQNNFSVGLLAEILVCVVTKYICRRGIKEGRQK